MSAKSDKKYLAEHPYCTIIGLDEVGKGAWAGPVTVGAVAIKSTIPLGAMGVDDSKSLTPRKRETLAPMIKKKSLAWAVHHSDAKVIDTIGIERATNLAMEMAFFSVAYRARGPIIALVDGNPSGITLRQAYRTYFIPKGDTTSLAIGGASIIAKVSRDTLMAERYEDDFPGYGFAQHKGYGTAIHTKALDNLGPCGIHRMTFKPVKQSMEGVETTPVKLQDHKTLKRFTEVSPNELMETAEMDRELRNELLATECRLLLDGSPDNKAGINLMILRRLLLDTEI
jgi:ribonuclease HII